jgi:UDP-GlcNAc:undecaprenyl-phosphate GlcNAc-1-phosphate transferase
MKTLLTFILSFSAAYLALPLVRIIAFRFGILDFPEKRKMHKVATPLLGGIAIYVSLVTGLFFNTGNVNLFFPVILGATFIFILGLVSDIIELSARLRFLWQFFIALTVVWAGVRVTFVPPGYLKDIVEALITAVWFVGVTNAYNYLDGLDGLAAGSAAINLFCFWVILYGTGQYPLGLLAISLIAACLAFLPYNFSSNKIFLGETGSTFLGFMLAGIGIMGDWAQDNVVRLSIPILILGVPIFDMIFTTVMRVKEGKVKNIMEWLRYAGKDHFHHYLVDLGFNPLAATLFIYLITLSLGISAIMVSNDVAIEAFYSIIQAAITFVVIGALIVLGKKRHKAG